MGSDWNAFLEVKLAADLSKEAGRLADAIARNTLGWGRRDNAIGQMLLRQASGLHGRSFERARAELVEAGLVRVVPGAGGRGNRDRYFVLIEVETPASGREFLSPAGTPAEVREFRGETPAETPAGERVGREKEEQLASFGSEEPAAFVAALTETGYAALRGQARAAALRDWSEHAHGVRAVVSDSRERGDRLGLVAQRFLDGDHRDVVHKVEDDDDGVNMVRCECGGDCDECEGTGWRRKHGSTRVGLAPEPANPTDRFGDLLNGGAAR